MPLHWTKGPSLTDTLWEKRERTGHSFSALHNYGLFWLVFLPPHIFWLLYLKQINKNSLFCELYRMWANLVPSFLHPFEGSVHSPWALENNLSPTQLPVLFLKENIYIMLVEGFPWQQWLQHHRLSNRANLSWMSWNPLYRQIRKICQKCGWCWGSPERFFFTLCLLLPLAPPLAWPFLLFWALFMDPFLVPNIQILREKSKGLWIGMQNHAKDSWRKTHCPFVREACSSALETKAQFFCSQLNSIFEEKLLPDGSVLRWQKVIACHQASLSGLGFLISRVCILHPRNFVWNQIYHHLSRCY